MKIGIDAREVKKIPLFKNYIKTPKCKLIKELEVKNYDVGDALTLDGIVGVERKHSDFVPDMCSGKLKQQLYELNENFKYPFLLIEYNGFEDLILNNLGMNPDSLYGEIASITARTNVRVIFVGGLYVPFVCKLIEKFYDGKTEIKNREYMPIRRGATQEELKVDIISRLPDIGHVVGKKVLEHFNYSFPRLLKAQSQHLVKIDGVATTKAKKIIKSLEVFR